MAGEMDRGAQDAWQPVFDALVLLRDSWPAPPWSWDGRFHTIAASFASDLEPVVRPSAVHAFPRGFTAKSLATAPPALLAIAERTGGLRAGQRLLAGAPAGDLVLYGLWWPWGGGETITLRIGFAGQDGAAEPVIRLRTLFGVEA
jgi:hypothetical protein